MSTINDLVSKYRGKIDYLDLELIIAHVIKKSREFVIAHPERKLSKYQVSRIKYLVSRRVSDEPLAYIVGHKEFFGLDFKVNKNTLIPRPETELLVELALNKIKSAVISNQPLTVVDIGTGSGAIIIAVAKSFLELRIKNQELSFTATDISKKALTIAKHNAKLNNVSNKIEFIHGNGLSPILENSKYEIRDTRFSKTPARRAKYVIVANLPYLSEEIYNSAPKSVKNFEPKSALLSKDFGLAHYAKIFLQVKQLCPMLNVSARSASASVGQCSIIIEHSPEQKPLLRKMILKHFPAAKIKFHKDLCGLWRIAEISPR